MKKNAIYTILIIVFIVAVGAIVYNYTSTKAPETNNTYALLPRKGVAADSPEWLKVKEQAYTLLKAIEANPKDAKSLTQLATLYIREARITGNYAYYDKAALNYVNNVLATDANNFEALILKSLFSLSIIDLQSVFFCSFVFQNFKR